MIPLLDKKVEDVFYLYFGLYYVHMAMTISVPALYNYYSKININFANHMVTAACIVIVAEIALALEIPHWIKK